MTFNRKSYMLKRFGICPMQPTQRSVWSCLPWSLACVNYILSSRSCRRQQLGGVRPLLGLRDNAKVVGPCTKTSSGGTQMEELEPRQTFSRSGMV